VVFIGIFGYTSLMDKEKYAIIAEGIRVALALYILFYFGDWFGLNAYFSNGIYIVAFYFISTIIGTAYFTYFESPLLVSKKIA